jgi:hypothetical protein
LSGILRLLLLLLLRLYLCLLLLLLLDELLGDELLELQLERFAALLPVDFLASRLKKWLK